MPSPPPHCPPDTLLIVLGDQLDRGSPLLVAMDRENDLAWMAEVHGEANAVWSHKVRIAFFLSAMRHFRDDLRARDIPLLYRTLSENEDTPTLEEALRRDIALVRPQRLKVLQPGEYRVLRVIEAVAVEAGLPLEVFEDPHFVCPLPDFNRHADARGQLRMEYFYRDMRRKTGLLMDAHGKPEGGAWNFDAENRGAFGKAGSGVVPPPPVFPPDALTRSVLHEVAGTFEDHPGDLDRFNWPLTPEDARIELADFIAHRLPRFGETQDAMWTGEAFLHHSRLSAAMNVKLLDPLEVCRMAEAAWRQGRVPLAAAEGFIRQIIGWREFVRGIYWRFMPGYLDRNALEARADLPAFYWTGVTDMACLREVIGQTLATGYAHHIQRLMVTGLFSLLLGVDPRQIHAWFLAIHLDAVEWVELPNTLGMSQYADGGILASKPYIASGNYIRRMSNYCDGCRYKADLRIGENACPFTTLYWDFLRRHRTRLVQNPRMRPQVRNLDRLTETEQHKIAEQAEALRHRLRGPRNP